MQILKKGFMKKYFVIASILLLAAGCSSNVKNSNGGVSSPAVQGAGKIVSIYIDPSRQEGNWTLYSSGAVVLVREENMQNVEIKYLPTGTGIKEVSLGQAVSLSSQKGVWALSLPKDLLAVSLWAEGADLIGNKVKSQDLGNVGYDRTTVKADVKNSYSIEYPQYFSYIANLADLKKDTYLPVCSSEMVGCIYYSGDEYKGTNLEAAAVSVNILKALNSEVKCYNFKVETNEAQLDEGVSTINGTDFYSASGGGGAVGHYSKVQVYRNFHNGKCYEVTQTVAGTNVEDYEPGTIKKFNSDEVWKRLSGIVYTFKFTDMVSQVPVSVPVTPSVQVSLTGTIVCLPHKNVKPGQPQTLECAIGLKESVTGKYYSLTNTKNPVFDTTQKVNITGTLKADTGSNYDVVGAVDGGVITIVK